jgi:hypothetical protein
MVIHLFHGYIITLLNYSTTLKMEAIRSSETSGTTQRTTRRHIPEEDTLQTTAVKTSNPTYIITWLLFQNVYSCNLNSLGLVYNPEDGGSTFL